jgi:hypothetical protein
VSTVEQKMAEVKGLIDRGVVEFVPGYEELPETKRPIRLTSEGHLIRVKSELKSGPKSLAQLFPSDALDLPRPSPEEWLRAMVSERRLEVEREEPFVVRLLDDDRRWREPR